ncbi:hypothetical protein A2U01_0021162, partial [Trifolium medium]|nr:hypothetical protein [Trifolium medium]
MLGLKHPKKRVKRVKEEKRNHMKTDKAGVFTVGDKVLAT